MNFPAQPGNPCDRKAIVRHAWKQDIETIVRLAKAIPTAAQWSRVQYETYCKTPDHAEAQAKTLFVASVLAGDITSHRQEVIGFAAFTAIPSVAGGKCELENMAVAEVWRRHGIARRFLQNGLLWCRAWCPADPLNTSADHGLSLEVRASNRGAIAFYEHLGFSANGCRPRYYKQPDDDAILMWKSLSAPFQTH